MCGIAGYFGYGNREILEKMTNTLAHRGPDDAGFYVDEQIGLGHRRLSIIDLSAAGHQPMWNADQTIGIVFNGEIYNFKPLRDDLEKKGHVFKSTSDTEVIISLYQEYGTDCFKKMNGMFAVALYDKPAARVVLARDRLGKKPLYWTMIKDALLFGSELKALLAHPLFQRKLSLRSLNEYLAFDYVPTPHTIFENVFKLEPGTALVVDSHGQQKISFWDIRFDTDYTAMELAGRGSLSGVLTELDRRLDEAVGARLVSDVPLGIFLSGGLDSSTIAYYAQKNSTRKIKTFSIGFEEKSYDESGYARQVAKILGTDHHEKILSAHDSLDLIPRIGAFIDEPVADYSFIPTYLLSRFTREHVTVALGGDGGDELFFGYGTLVAEGVLNVFKNHPEFLEKVLRLARKLIPTSHASFNTAFKIDRFLAGVTSSPLHRHHAWMGTFSRTDRAELLQPEVWQQVEKENEYRIIDDYGIRLKKENRYNQLIYLYLRTYLMDQVLVKVDRMSMAASLEVRAPFLDYTLVDFVNSIPYTFKVKGFQTKYLLKKLMETKLPHSIVYRKKQGFGVPLSQWFAGELKEFVQDTLSPERLKKTGLFRLEVVEKIIHEHLSKKRDNRKMLWSLIVWQLWYERWFLV